LRASNDFFHGAVLCETIRPHDNQYVPARVLELFRSGLVLRPLESHLFSVREIIGLPTLTLGSITAEIVPRTLKSVSEWKCIRSGGMSALITGISKINVVQR
jgi:hypothetical protein